MKGAKQGQNAPRERIVKQRLDIRVVVAILLALIGTTIYFFAYQYTHSAKLEAELQKVQRLQQDTVNSSEQEQKQLEDKIKKLEAELQARNAQKAQLAALSQKRASASSVKVTGTCSEWMSQAGIAITNATTNLIIKESGCRPTARNASSGACGIPQALPCSKLANVCPNWQTDPVCQLRWMDTYVKNRYGTWEKAYSTWLSRSPHWY